MPIQVNNIFHSYFKKTENQVDALRGVSLTIEDGSYTAIVGETGSGKSTLIQHLNGLLLPDEGEVVVNGLTIQSKKRKNKDLQKIRKQLGVIFQFPEQQLFEETVIKDVMFGPKNFGMNEKDAETAAKQALANVGIPESYYEKSPFELSGGERRKVAIAGILAINPDIIVLDEPTAGLDFKSGRNIMDLVKEMNNNGKTIILVTHDMYLVMKYAQHVFYIKNGKLFFSGKPTELFELNDDVIEVPQMFTLCKLLKDKGVNIDLDNIHGIDDITRLFKEQKL